MRIPDRFAEIYDHMPTAGDKRLFLAGFVGAISNHLSKETINHCIDVALNSYHVKAPGAPTAVRRLTNPAGASTRNHGKPSISICDFTQGENT